MSASQKSSLQSVHRMRPFWMSKNVVIQLTVGSWVESKGITTAGEKLNDVVIGRYAVPESYSNVCWYS